MSNYPNSIDNDATLPAVNDNISQIGEEAINALRDAVFQIEMALGINIAGTQPSLAARLGVFINQDGSPNTSVLYNLGLVTLPVTNNQIADNAGIPESKLHLDFRTQDLYNYIRDLAKDVNLAIGWISVSGVKLEPHLIGAIYRHDLAQIDVAETSTQFLNNVFRTLRDNTDAYTLVNDINNELLAHQWADGSAFGTIQNIVTNNGSIYPSNYAHVASGIYLDTSGFAVIPQTALSVQALADYLDQSSLSTLGSRLQNLFANGISRNSQSSNLTSDGYGQLIIPVTPAIAFLLGNTGNSSSPVDNINYGDDIIQLLPSSDDGYVFDEQFSLVQPGDIITVNYSGDGYNVAVPYIILERKFSYTPATNSNQTYIVRIAGKNFAYAPNATVQINRSLYNTNKYGVLSVAGVNSPVSNVPPSLIVGAAKGAQCTGVGFSPDQFNESHYLLYLALYPDGNPLDGYTFLPGIDVTGNQGTTPGSYTLQSIVESTNQAFRQPGFNYRFTAFQFEGQFGIMLADSYDNTSFSVVSAVMGPNGMYDPIGTSINFPNNVVGVFPNTITVGAQTLPESTVTVNSTTGFSVSGVLSVVTTTGVQNVSYTGLTGTTFTGASGGLGSVISGSAVTQPISVPLPDPLGFGPFGANIASPPYMTTIGWGSIVSALVPTRLFVPLLRNNYYVNGSELDTFPLDVSQAEDNFGDGYWVATIASVTPNAGPPGSVSVTYNIPLNLSNSGLRPGKTIVVQPIGGNNYGLVNYGRYFIQSVNFTTCAPFETQVTVYDAVHAQGGSPYPVAAVGSTVGLYFNSSSVTFDAETATDFSAPTPYSTFKRHFEVFIDDNGNTFTHERGRLCTGGTTNVNDVTLYSSVLASAMDIVSISPKLRGYTFGSVTKINLYISSFNSVTGQFVGNLQSYNGTATRPGPTVIGRVGEVVRFYDETNIDYVDIFFGLTSIPASTSNQFLDIQLFPTLALDENIMIIASCQVNGSMVSQIVDLREFGNTSEEQFTTSALNYISASDRLLHTNGVVRGFNAVPGGVYGTAASLSVTGGLTLVDGNLAAVDDELFIIPPLQEYYEATYYPINYALCVNSGGELVTVVLTDYDSVLGTPNGTLNRVVFVINVVSSTTYSIDSCSFSYLLNDRKDLTVLYIVSATVSGSGSTATTSLSTRDVRRYVNDSDSGIIPILTNDNSQGNFQSLAAAINWLRFNNAFQSRLEIRGQYTISLDPGLVNIPGLTLIGNGGNPSLTFAVAPDISETVFSNLAITAPAGLVVSGQTTFNNCNVTLSGSSNISDAVFNGGVIVISAATSISGCTFNNCTIITLAQIALGSGTSFVGCTFDSNVNGIPTVFNINSLSSSVSNISFSQCLVNYTPSTTGTTYSAANLINSGYGFIYSSVGSIQNITVEDCQFFTTSSTRFPFISLEYNNFTNGGLPTVVQGAYIVGNKFYNQTSMDDRYAVIAFNCNLGTSQPTEGLKLIDCKIQNNFCDKNQIISIAGNTTVSGNYQLNCSIVPISTIISGNTCGIISVSGAADNDRNYETYSNGIGYDKYHGVTISNNTCRYIGMLDSTGQSLFGRAWGVPGSLFYRYITSVNTCATTISQNACSWIHMAPAALIALETSAAAYAMNSHVSVLNNKLRGYDPGFLSAIGEQSVTNIGIGMALGNTSYIGASTITGNTVMQGSSLNSSNAVVTWDYASSLFIGVNSIISENTFNNIAAGGDMIATYADSQLNVTITDNQFYRNANSVNSYINVGGNGKYLITDNFFDSTTTNGTSTALIAGTLSNILVLSNNANYVGVSTTILAAGSTIVYSTPIVQTIVQPLIISASNGLSVTSTVVPTIGAANADYVNIVLSQFVNQNVPTQISVTLNAIGTANGDNNMALYIINQNTGAITSYPIYGLFEPGDRGIRANLIYPWAGNVIPAIDTSTYTYVLHVTGDSGTTTGVISVAINFSGYTQLLPTLV